MQADLSLSHSQSLPPSLSQVIGRHVLASSAYVSYLLERYVCTDGSHPVLHYMEGQPLQWKDLEEGHNLAEVSSEASEAGHSTNISYAGQIVADRAIAC